MTSRASFPFFALFGLALPLFTAQAQMPYSPASPPNTGSPYSGAMLPRQAPARQPQVQAGVPITGVSVVNGGYVTNSQVMTSEPIDPGHKLGRGDLLSYQVIEDREPEKIYDLQVSDTGDVNLPLGGYVKAAGKTAQQLSLDIKSRLESEYYKHATVMMGLKSVAQRASRGRVYVTGAVKTVGSVELPLDQPMTASQAIYQMGGPVDFSNLKRTKVIRKGGPKGGIPVNVKAVESGDLDKDVVLQPGDQVSVPEAKFIIKG